MEGAAELAMSHTPFQAVQAAGTHRMDAAVPKRVHVTPKPATNQFQAICGA